MMDAQYQGWLVWWHVHPQPCTCPTCRWVAEVRGERDQLNFWTGDRLLRLALAEYALDRE